MKRSWVILATVWVIVAGVIWSDWWKMRHWRVPLLVTQLHYSVG